MKERKRGRPPKANPVKAGELQKGLCRFTFVADETLVMKIKMDASEKRVSIKKLMDAIITEYYKRKGKPRQKNENLLKNYLSNDNNSNRL